MHFIELLCAYEVIRDNDDYAIVLVLIGKCQ